MPFQDIHLSPKKMLERYKIKPKKRLGQHFLLNPFIAYQIVEKTGIKKDDIVIEIGAGLGALTIPLAKKAKKVVAIEYDKELVLILTEILRGLNNVEIWQGDALKYDYKSLNKKIIIVGNLPYYITSPLLFLFLEQKNFIKEMTFMLQKEVAQRLLSSPGKKTYGLLTVLYGLVANINSIMTLAPQSFYPTPEVASQVIKIVWREEYNIEKEFIEFLKKIFSFRRKTLLNALKKLFTQEKAKYALSTLNLPYHIRPEQIEPSDFLRLFHLLKSKDS